VLTILSVVGGEHELYGFQFNNVLNHLGLIHLSSTCKQACSNNQSN